MALSIEKKLTFPGGTHPNGRKELAAEMRIKAAPAPKELAVMLSQHIGAFCKPLVKKGDSVAAGEKIGAADAFVSAAVHSPVKGVVKGISLRSHVVLGRGPAVIIEPDQQNEGPEDFHKLGVFEDFRLEDYPAETILAAVAEAGIVGMGGAGFPTRVKIEPSSKPVKKTLIVNGCECEPYITGDYRVMVEWAPQVIAGAMLAQKAAGCTEVFLAIEDNKPKAIEAMKNAVGDFSVAGENIKVVTVRTKYPQGGERQLVRALLKKEIPTGSIPPAIGVVILNVATCAAIAAAAVSGEPLTHRVVSVTGEGILEPSNYYCPIGISVRELIEASGGFAESADRVILGGPMMGISIADLSTPVTKTTGAITVLKRGQIEAANYNKVQTACIRCGRCIEVCPAGINPTKIAHTVKNGLIDLAESYYISACIECGCCSYVCPANIGLTGLIKSGKIYLATKDLKVPK